MSAARARGARTLACTPGYLPSKLQHDFLTAVTTSRLLPAARAAVRAIGLVALAACATAPRAGQPAAATVAAPAGVQATTSPAGVPAAPDRDYLVFVGSEATDKIALVRFGPGGARIERESMTG